MKDQKETSQKTHEGKREDKTSEPSRRTIFPATKKGVLTLFNDWLALAKEFLSFEKSQRQEHIEKTEQAVSLEAVESTPKKTVGIVKQAESNIVHEPPENSTQQQDRRKDAALSIKAEDPVALNLQSSRQPRPLEQPLENQRAVFNGIRTQICPETSDRDGSHLIIGIDLGTSSTKVVVRDWILNQAYAVPFNKYAPQSNCYLLPTRIFVNHNGTMCLDAGDIPIAELKHKFITDPAATIVLGKGTGGGSSLNAEEIFIGYLALVLREARGWFFSQTHQQYFNKGIQWYINIGVPSETYEDNRLRKRYEQAAQIAWLASAQQQEITIGLIKESVNKIEKITKSLVLGDFSMFNDACLHPSYFAAHPEVIMEVVGYTKSPLGRQGTHMLIDVGASTLDVATFRVGKREGDDLYAILSCKVAWLGSLILHNKRIESLESETGTVPEQILQIDVMRPLPPIEKYQNGNNGDVLKQIDKKFGHSCRKVIGEVVRVTKESRDPNSEVWKSMLPVFICGGGMREKIYQKVVIDLSSALARSLLNFRGFNFLRIPKPETLQAPHVAPDEYDRLAVAYGLSFSSDEIGYIRPKSSVKDQLRELQIYDSADKYVGAEQM